MMPNAETKVYGIFGNPVRHSLSPRIHNALFSEFGINAFYAAFEVERDSLNLAFEAVRSLGLGGVNLTVPFKEQATGLVDEIAEDVDRRIGAINTVVNRGGVLYGHNTDGPGFITALRTELGMDPMRKRALILGAGGAARGVAFALAWAGAERIWIHNRHAERAEGLAAYLRDFVHETKVEAVGGVAELRGEKLHLVVNATPCGLHPQDDPPVDLGTLDKTAAVMDLIYSPVETALLRASRADGRSAANGIGMLAAQAALSFELWTGRREGVREKMLEILSACAL